MPLNSDIPDRHAGYPVRKLIIVDNFDHIPGISQPTINGTVVSISGDRISLTDRQLPAEVTSRFQRSDIKLPSPLSSAILTGNDESHRQKLNSSQQLVSIFGPAYKGPTETKEPPETTLSAQTLYIDEPIPQETPEKYDRSRKYFSYYFTLACVTAVILLVHIYLWVCYFGDGIIPAPKHTFPTKKAEIVSESRRYYNIHMSVMLSMLVSLQGLNTVAFRLLHRMTKFKVKYIHSFIGFVGAVGAAGGVYYAASGHNTNKKPHFLSVHSNLGMFTFTAYQLHFWSSFIILLLPFPWMSVKVAFVPLHKFLGSSVYVCAVATAVTGAVMITAIVIPGMEHQTLPPRSVVINSLGMLVVLDGLCLTCILAEFTFRRRQRPDESVGLMDEKGKEVGLNGLGSSDAHGDHLDIDLSNSGKVSSSASKNVVKDGK